MDSKVTTSKQLTWVLIGFYILAVTGVGIVYIVFDKNMFELLNYILPLSMTVVLSYFGKAGFENYGKIKLAKQQGQSLDIDLGSKDNGSLNVTTMRGGGQ